MKVELICPLHGPFGDSSPDFCPGCVVVAENEPDSAKSQIEALADFIIAEVDGEPCQNEGAVDCAIRVIKILKSDLVTNDSYLKTAWKKRDDANDTLREIRDKCLEVIPKVEEEVK